MTNDVIMSDRQGNEYASPRIGSNKKFQRILGDLPAYEIFLLVVHEFLCGYNLCGSYNGDLISDTCRDTHTLRIQYEYTQNVNSMFECR